MTDADHIARVLRRMNRGDTLEIGAVAAAVAMNARAIRDDGRLDAALAIVSRDGLAFALTDLTVTRIH